MDSSFIENDGMVEPILPIELKPSVFRPFAYRVLSKKYGLNVQSTALEKLASYVGRRFGTKWRIDPKTSAFLDAVAKLWKEQGRGIFVDGDGIAQVIKEIVANEQRTKKRILDSKIAKNSTDLDADDSMSFDTTNFDSSIQFSSQLIEQPIEIEETIDWKQFFKATDVNHYTKFFYDRRRKQFEYNHSAKNHKLIQLPDADTTLNFYMGRLDILRDRIYRNNIFSKVKYDKSVESKTNNQMHQPKHITYVKNLLGRNEQRFILFGLVTLNSFGVWQLQDDSDKIELVLKHCIFPKDSFFTSGNFLIVDGFYSNAGKFHVLSVAHPPAEDRETSIDAFGNLDFNWDYSKNGKIDLTMQKLTNKQIKKHPDHKIVVLGGDLYLDELECITKLKKVLQELETELQGSISTQDSLNSDVGSRVLHDRTVAIVFNGPFISKALTVTEGTSANQMTSSGLYKASFDNLALILESFKLICEHSKLIFVPGDEDPWLSMVTRNSNAIWPKMKIPTVFGTKLQRIVKDIVWVSNPCRLNYLSHDIAIMKDNLGESLRRNDFSYLCELSAEEIEKAMMNNNETATTQLSQLPSYVNDKNLEIDKLTSKENSDMIKFKKIIKTILDQGIMSPFSSQVRTLIPNYWPLLSLLPLPNCLIISDNTAPSLSSMYKGCLVSNVGRFLDGNNRAHYLEYYPSSQTAKTRVVY
jgi:DNA polymerase epsilon subunit 2